MLDRVARLSGAPCLLARGTRLGGVSFRHVNGSCRVISANRGEINRANMAEVNFFVVTIYQCYPAAEQNNSQFEEINIVDESQAENRPVPVQEAEITWKKFPWSAVMFVVLRGHSKDSPRSPLTGSVR